MRVLPCVVLLVAVSANAQNINISDFYYRDYLDFGQNKGAFGANSPTISKKDGTEFKIPQIPDFSASSNYGSLTSIGRGFAVTANHVSSPESVSDLRKWGLTKYNIAQQFVGGEGNEVNGISKPYGRDDKFMRLDKYVVEGQVNMLDIQNTTQKSDEGKQIEQKNLDRFKAELANFQQDDDGNIYIYQAGSG